MPHLLYSSEEYPGVHLLGREVDPRKLTDVLGEKIPVVATGK